MSKECYFKEIQLHIWFVILLLITNQNGFTQTQSLEINTVNLKFTSEIKYSERVLIAILSNIKINKPSEANKNKGFTSRIRYEFIVIPGLLFIILGLLFCFKKIKKKNQQKLQSKREQIGKQNEALKKLDLEKEWLLKELHHRVKNNLQIVISLLNTQLAYLENKEALLAIQDSQHRMNAMALIYQKIYESENLEIIDMCWYIPELVHYLEGIFNTDKKIFYKLDIDCVDLDVSQAIPIGLILNEAIINASKYAYPEIVQGEVNIRLKKIEEDDFQLIISDNGVGVPEHFELKNRNSLGMNLMQGLTAQIDGTFSIENKNGLTITIYFKAAKNNIIP